MTPENTIRLLDWCRWFFLAQAGFVGVASVVIWIKYAIKVGRDTASPHVWHIVTISASYIGAICYIAIATSQMLGHPVTWRFPLAGFIFVSGDAGLCFMLSHLYSHRVYAKTVRERLLQKEIEVTLANTAATAKNTEALNNP